MVYTISYLVNSDQMAQHMCSFSLNFLKSYKLMCHFHVYICNEKTSDGGVSGRLIFLLILHGNAHFSFSFISHWEMSDSALYLEI